MKCEDCNNLICNCADDVKFVTPPIVFTYEEQIKDLETKLKFMNRLTEDQAIELQKRETLINKLKEDIEYALFQRDCDYGMGDSYIHFTMRKVFSILEECLEVFDEAKS